MKRQATSQPGGELATLAQLEENIFYPAVNEETDEGPALLKENLAEYKAMKNLIQQLRNTDPHSRGVYQV